MIENNFKVRPECLRNLKISSLLLKRAASKGLTLTQIGQILCRPDDDEEAPSLLEKIVNKAQLLANLRIQLDSKFKRLDASPVRIETSNLSLHNLAAMP